MSWSIRTDACFLYQAEDGIRDLVRSRGLGDVYKRQDPEREKGAWCRNPANAASPLPDEFPVKSHDSSCLSLIHI